MIKWLLLHWRAMCLSLLALVTVLSLSPLPELPSAGGDKLHHYLAYSAVTLPIGLSLARGWWKWALCCLIWSGVIELIQPFVNRHGELLDLFANGIGIVSGLLIGAFLKGVFIGQTQRS